MTLAPFRSLNAPTAVYLSDVPHRIVYTQQAWGNLGLDVCAHGAGQTPLPLRIKSKTYAKGLGHHASGEIVVDLNGEYDAFEAEVGVQWQQGTTGSVVFQVFVDDRKRFDSGVMRERDAPRSIHVPLAGAQEMRLVVSDAGDGITCDCADWAEARLVPAAAPSPQSPQPPFDIAPFARIVGSDPTRTDGARANRIQEYRSDDLFLEKEVARAADGTYLVPVKDGIGSIGLLWEEKRTFCEIGAEFEGTPPPASGVRLEAWFGESPFQGQWRPVSGTIEAEGNRWLVRVDPNANPDLRSGTRKIRWILPAGDRPVSVRRLTALTPARLDTVTVRLQLEKPMPGETGVITVYNGSIENGENIRRAWDLARPITLTLRALRSRSWQPDRTLLRLVLPTGAFGIAIDDLLKNEAVYVPHAGLFACRADSKVSLAAYKRRIAGRKTVLDRVREMPDQTLSQALAKTHRPAQDNGPMLLSLACDNRKFVVQREGAIRFEARPENTDRNVNEPLKQAGEVEPRFADGKVTQIKRRLDGGWLPAHVTEGTADGIHYRQRAYVTPFDNTSTGWLNRKPLCVVEYTLANPQTHPAAVTMSLAFRADADAKRAARLETISPGVTVLDGDRLLACVDTAGASPLRLETADGVLTLRGDLPARAEARIAVLIPGWPVHPDEAGQLHGSDRLWTDFESYWRGVMAPAVSIETPDRFLNDVIRASQVHCLIAARNEADGSRIAPWIASMHYGPLESESNSIVRGMDMLGHHAFAQHSLDYYVARYSPEGMLTTGYTLMGTGWHLWTLGEHFALTQDTAWLQRVAPDVKRVCRWIVAQRAKTQQDAARAVQPSVWGLVPPGVMADWNAFAYYFCLNGYYYAGLRHAALALAAQGDPDAPALLREADGFREDILLAFLGTQALAPVFALQNGTWIPEYPSQVHAPGPTGRYFPGEDGNRSWCYDVELGAHHLVPQGVLAPTSPEVTRMLEHMEDVQFLSDGWFDYPGAESRKDWYNLGGFSKVQPYYTRNGEIYAMRDDVKPFIRSYFNTLAAMLNTENLSLWEHFHASGAWNKTHETGYFLQQTRWMLVMERGNELWLAPFTPAEWLKDGRTIAVDHAPSAFGPVSFRITSHAAGGAIEAVVEMPSRGTPESVVLRLRHPEGRPIRSVTVNGEPYEDFTPKSETIRLRPLAGRVTVRAEYGKEL